ncbi:hypothetical protein SELMODRAFT_429352 [Selaginella moellendorffii]|uniref:Uncharacterized protein n=1 Tax=Selaginella moellendorffii TaxID=88036 RepID=D8T5W3_SELML|nr:hypothetical protein SELMODRAFT_429352 [Selaginella moellendorffii]
MATNVIHTRLLFLLLLKRSVHLEELEGGSSCCLLGLLGLLRLLEFLDHHHHENGGDACELEVVAEMEELQNAYKHYVKERNVAVVRFSHGVSACHYVDHPVVKEVVWNDGGSPARINVKEVESCMYHCEREQYKEGNTGPLSLVGVEDKGGEAEYPH